MKLAQDAVAVTKLLQERGALSSSEIQGALKLSQPTVSRLLNELRGEVFRFGAARSSRYALSQTIGALPAQQAVWRIEADGKPVRLGELTFLAKSQIHLGSDNVDEIFNSSSKEPLPWLLSGLQPQGFLGRLLAQRMGNTVSSTNPENWNTEEILIAACQTHDVPGSIVLGTSVSARLNEITRLSAAHLGADLDRLTRDIAKTLPAGSSAGGEQPKLLAFNETGDSFVVKFSPPRGTPYGDRWSELLLCESICAKTLNDFGIQAAQSELIQTDTRTYLLSRRFDRQRVNGAAPEVQGRRHVVSIGAAHAGFCKGSYINWASSCMELARQGRLPKADAGLAHDLIMFGRLIGNSDMHSGNASLFVKGENLKQMLEGQFVLAPIYDMLPMRWKPDATIGLYPYETFEPDFSMASEQIRSAARAFWIQVSEHPLPDENLRSVAIDMSARMGSAGI